MTEVINLFQAIFTFKSFTNISVNRAEIRLAAALKRDAEKFEVVAEQEIINGGKTQKLAFESSDKGKVQTFTEISLWHFGRAAEKYRKSAARFEETGKLYVDRRKVCVLKAQEMKRRAAKAEAAVQLMNGLLEQN